jgi:hypothetical protein
MTPNPNPYMKNLIFIFIGCVLLWACSQPKPAPEPAEAEATPQPTEIVTDPKYVEIGKQGLRSLAEGNVDDFMSSFADSAQFSWNNGDSIMGKPAITAYWKERRGKAIDTLTYRGDVWLAIKANEPPGEGVQTGIWLFGWFRITVTYANGNKMTQWIHNLYHFDGSDKIDYTAQFLDRAPINAAASAKKKK